jgi:NAD(P)-dependent dehydrogenase (short-subunit alcohol dehydrogenase family)
MKPIEEQVILVTGATDGIGKQAAADLAAKGAIVLLHGRSREKCSAVADEIKRRTGNEKLRYFTADYTSLAEVKHMADAIKTAHSHLDVLINNAGIGGGDLNETSREISQDGYELRLAVNYLAPFLLTTELLPLLMNGTSRTVNVASMGQSPIDLSNLMLERDYTRLLAYKQSKLALIAWTFEFADRFGNRNVTFNALHPGTQLNTKMVQQSGLTPLGGVQIGSDSILHLALSPEVEEVNGQYFNEMRPGRALDQTYDKIFRKRLWEVSEDLIYRNKHEKASPGL